MMHADILRWRGLRHSTRAAHALGSSSKPGHQTQAGKHNPPSQGWESSCLWGAGGCSARAQPRQGEPLLHPQRAGRPGHTAAAAAAAQVVPGRAGSAHLVLRRVGPRCQPAAARTSRAGAGRGALCLCSHRPRLESGRALILLHALLRPPQLRARGRAVRTSGEVHLCTVFIYCCFMGNGVPREAS